MHHILGLLRGACHAHQAQAAAAELRASTALEEHSGRANANGSNNGAEWAKPISILVGKRKTPETR